jgi:hypothetical protein
MLFVRTESVVYLFGKPQHMPCEDCGLSLAREEAHEHVCDPERRLDYRMIQLRTEIERFGAELSAYLESPRGRFEVWWAARWRRDGSEDLPDR